MAWRLLPAVFAAVLALCFASAQDEPAKKPFFLPKTATAAAYVLGRLSNSELIAAPRSEFVYVALLQRAGLERKYRIEALEGLAGLRHTDALTELLRGLDELDKKGEPPESVQRDLAAILTGKGPAALSGKRDDLQKLADESQAHLTRQIAYAALLTADGNPDKVWPAAQGDPAKLADLLSGIPLVRESATRAALYPRVEPLLRQTGPSEVVCAAITAAPALPNHDAETFHTLAGFLQAGTERPATVAGLRKIPRAAWPRDQVAPLLASLIKYLESVPVAQRTEPEAVNAFQLASDLAAALPPEAARAAAKNLRALGVSILVLHTIREQMLFDKSLLVVEAGKPVQIILMNDDAMPHNLVVVAPGALEEIGQVAEKMPPEPDAEGRLYIPASPKVLQSSRMAEPGQQITLSFTAPEEPGDYQFVCTFPGHWRRMTGTLAVVKDVEAYVAAHAAAPQPTVTEWKIDDLKPDLANGAAGRNPAAGRDLFTKLACAQCHKIGGQGANYGPDLSDVFPRYGNDGANVLRQILEPSLVISNRFLNYEFELKDGESVFGMITKEAPDELTIQTGPSDAMIKTLKKSEFTSRKAQASSVMPVGLLNQLSKEQILDLLAFLESGGRTAP